MGQVIKDDSVKCGIFIFPSDDWHWIASLELLLIDKLRPKFNKRLPYNNPFIRLVKL